MTFRTEFPDFDPATLPLIPEGWTDQSWHNDSCPCFNTGKGVVVFVDYADKSLREFEEGARFSIHSDPEITDSNDVLFESDDWNEIVAFVVADAFAAVLREWLKPEEFRAMKVANETDRAYATDSCASHDYCDANMAMSEAFLRALKREPNIAAGVDLLLWNAAWESARKRHIGSQA